MKEPLYKPVLFSAADQDGQAHYHLLVNNHHPLISDTYPSQLAELIRLRHPSQQLTIEASDQLIKDYTQGKPLNECGNWVYYPWSNRLIHLLEENEFIEVRTNRNKLKITQEEQQLLKQKTIGIIGLSVGHSVALTMATERICGRLKLADFDTLDLSNLNRIRSAVHQLGLNKAIISAREIAELDPYLNVEVFDEGITAHNENDFFDGDHPIDLLVEVCDALPVKVSSRMHARKRKIPVVMDTNDRGMIDVERFDLEPLRPLFHGLVDESILLEAHTFPREKVIPMLMQLVSFDQASERLKLSMSQLGKTITTWPQLASSVMIGGGATCDVARRILTGTSTQSGRFYLDPENLIN